MLGNICLTQKPVVTEEQKSRKDKTYRKYKAKRQIVWVKPGPGVSIRLLASRAGSPSPVARPGNPRAHFRVLVGRLVPDTVGYGPGVS